MARYHINPETGLPNKCSETIRCSFGDINDEHWNSKAEALKAAVPSKPEPIVQPLDHSGIPNPWVPPDGDEGKTWISKGLRDEDKDQNLWRKPIYHATRGKDKPQPSITRLLIEAVKQEHSTTVVYEGEFDRMKHENLLPH